MGVLQTGLCSFLFLQFRNFVAKGSLAACATLVALGKLVRVLVDPPKSHPISFIKTHKVLTLECHVQIKDARFPSNT